MIGLKHEKPPEVTDTEVVLGGFELIDMPDSRQDFGVAFNMCVEQSRGGDGVSIAEYELPEFDLTDEILGQILKNTPVDKADLIRLVPMGGKSDVERHMFFLKKAVEVKVWGNTRTQAVTIFFDIEHKDQEILCGQLNQRVQDGDAIVEKIVNLDVNGRATTSHVDGKHKHHPLSDRKICQKDLTEIAASVGVPVTEVVQHTTEEFDAIQSPPVLNLPKNRIARAAFVLGHPDSIERVA